MMNKNVKKAYEELIDIRNVLKYTNGIVTVNEWIDRLSTCVNPLLGEEKYGFFAGSLQQHVQSYHDKKVTKAFILEYVSKLIELIELNNKPAYSEEAKAMYEDAKTICEDIANTVQRGFDVTKEMLKTEGPKYATEAKSSLKGLSKKLSDNLQKWLSEDSDEEEDSEDGNRWSKPT